MDGLQDDTTLPPACSPVDEQFSFNLMEREARKKKARDAAVLERIRRPYAEYKRAHPQGDLCQRCAGIDWSLLLPSETSYYCEGFGFLELFSVPESSQELRTSTCPLCLLLSLDQDQTVLMFCACYKLCHLNAGSTLPRSQYDWTHHAPYLYVMRKPGQSRYMLQDARANTQHYVLRKLAPERIDYEILRHWLRHCKRHHHTKCNPNFLSSIPGLRVFDCKAGKVVAAPEDTAFRYIALSYVWGGVEITPKDPKEFPATIRDAITVTLKLDYRYLWVDQLCVHQSNETHKQSQIKLMGRIYAESELVIVAAAGSTSHYGLPGVSTRPRKAQRMIELDTEVQLIEMFDNDSTLRESVWAKRGWTHQEGYLAARRLVFTDNEVSYSCERGVCQESVKRPGIDDHDFYMENYYPGFPLETKSQNRVADVLNSYSARKLSFEGDILSACTGTLEKLVDLHFWGIVARISASTSDIELSLEWSNYPYPGQKRTNFPSWSWVATTGTKRIKVDTHRNDRSFVAEVLATDGRWLTSGNHIESRYDSLPEGSGPTLRLTGSFYTASLMSGKLQKHGEESEKRPLVVFQYTDATGDGNELVLELWLDTELTDPILPVTVKAVPFNDISGVYSTWGLSHSPIFMVLQAVGDHYRRIGATDREPLIRSKKTGLSRLLGQDDVIPRPGDEETIYIE